MLLKVKQTILPFIIVFYSGIFGTSASACSIPVFAYALYRWPADPYEVIVFHKGAMAPGDQAVVDRLKEIATDRALYSNYTVHTIDLETELNESMQELWAGQLNPTLPWMMVRYPANVGEVWSGHLDAAVAKALVDSPARQEIAERILNGQAAVWVLLESGDKSKDEQAAELLKTHLDNITKEIEKEIAPAEFTPETQPDEQDEPEWKIAFSVLRLSPTDPAEQMFVTMLLNTEPDLRSFPEPMAFPVFGRGRILYTLVGKGINEDNIGEACAFLVEGCSCQIKMANPGIDLLMSVDWDAALEGQWDKGAQSILLTGWPELPSPTALNAAQSDLPDTSINHGSATALLRNSLLGVALGMIIVAAAGLILRRRHHLGP